MATPTGESAPVEAPPRPEIDPKILWPILNDQAACLSVLAQAPAPLLKRLVDDHLLPGLPAVAVVHNVSGLVMIPARDTAQGVAHHLGEALVSEARVRIGAAEGYGACLGADLEQAVAIAVADAAVQSGLLLPIIGPFVTDAARRLEADEAQMRLRVQLTKVEMETF